MSTLSALHSIAVAYAAFQFCGGLAVFEGVLRVLLYGGARHG